jgi:hypothetical protein
MRWADGAGTPLCATAAILVAVACGGADGETTDAARGPRLAAAADSCSVWSEYRGLLGEGSAKIRRDGEDVFVWAGGDESGPGAEWYEFTGAPVDPTELQYGLGADAIPSIDVPLFVEPDDPRLLQIRPSPYRRCERPETADEIMVIGYVAAGQPRAYPTALLDRHEVVNETANGKPFTVGW